mmetsp:Transcript_32779/g.99063  ORF Transcript_32779/g.99063 Transcript_32779/m.99063 type:complete len:209 (-) Transcript_32779:4218-4844(-)
MASNSSTPHTVKKEHCRSADTVHGPLMNMPPGQAAAHRSHWRSELPPQGTSSKKSGKHSSEHRVHEPSDVEEHTGDANDPAGQTVQSAHTLSAVAPQAVDSNCPSGHCPEHSVHSRSVLTVHALDSNRGVKMPESPLPLMLLPFACSEQRSVQNVHTRSVVGVHGWLSNSSGEHGVLQAEQVVSSVGVHGEDANVVPTQSEHLLQVRS